MVIKMKKFIALIVIIILLLSLVITGCNSDSDAYYEDEDCNELQDEYPNDSDMVFDLDSYEAINRFRDFAFEMDRNGQISTRERVIEVFGTPYSDDGYVIEFNIATDFSIFAVLNDAGVVVFIVIEPVPDFYINDDLQPDFEQLRYYEQNPGGRTLEYFEAFFEAPALIVSYGHGQFTYIWKASVFEFIVHVDINNNVESIDFWHLGDAANGMFEEVAPILLIISEDAVSAFNNLAWEMQGNGGQISPERAKEIVSFEYYLDNQLLIFSVAEGVDIFVIVQEDNIIEQAFVSISINFYLYETLEVDMEALEVYFDDISDKTLEYFQELLGHPGVLVHYQFNEFIYIWITPSISVYVIVDPSGNVIEFYAYQVVDHVWG